MSLDQELLAQIDKYKEIMQKDPNSREFLTLADLYRKLGVAEEATHILQDGLKKHPDFVEARLAIARIYLTQGQVEDATREFEQVIQQDASNFVAYKLLGEIAMQKQEHEKAAERFGAAYHLKPDDQECKVMLDYIGSLLGKDVTPQLEGAPPPQQAAAPPPAPTTGETIAVAPDGEFGEFEEFEEAEELEEVGELEEEVASLKDMLRKYYLDTIGNVGLVTTRKYLEKELCSRYALEGMSFMSPGSLENWPIEEQRPLFDLLENVQDAIGVELTENLLMLPGKTVSGIYFPTEISFFSCQLCPRKECMGRKAAYSEELAKEYGIVD